MDGYVSCCDRPLWVSARPVEMGLMRWTVFPSAGNPLPPLSERERRNLLYGSFAD